MDANFIKAILIESLPGHCRLRPDILQAAASAAVEGASMDLASTRQGDAADMPEIIDLLFKSALFAAAATNIVHDIQEIVHREIDRRARMSDKRLEGLPDEVRKLIIDALIEHLRREK